MHFQAAIFDMDGTLIDSLVLWDLFWQELSKRFLTAAVFRPSAADNKAVRTMTLSDAMNLIHQKYHIGSSGEELFQIVRTLTTDFYQNKVEMKPGAKAFLDYLKAHGTKMCIATATDPDLVRMAMDRCGLHAYFDKVFSCSDVGKGKEAPDVFLKAREYLGCAAEDTWVFEDSLVAVETAAAIGMPTVAVYDKNNFGQEQMKQIATRYIGKDETLMRLTEKKA